MNLPLSTWAFALILAVVSACESNEPSAEGLPFLTARIDDAPWTPGNGPSDLVAVLQAGRVMIVANRFIESAQVGEFVQIEFAAADPFKITSYPLAGGSEGFGIVRVQQGGDPDALYQTNSEHTGFVAIQAADPSDSTVAGTFAFEAGQLGGTGLRQIRGWFRVRYVTSFAP